MQADTMYALAGLLNRKGKVSLPAEGTSMFPIITRGDVCCFAVCDPSALQKGDIILFRTRSSRLVAHRFYAAVRHGDEMKYICKGDTNLGYDEPVGQEQIMGRLMSIHKNKRSIRSTDFTARLWAFLIITFPVLTLLLRGYLSRYAKGERSSR